MSDEIRAYTKMDPIYPGYVNIKKADDGSVVLTVRGDPKNREGSFICGYAKDKGQPGRCTPGDDHCNNYCNLAPEKGRMQDHPLKTTHVDCGSTAVITLTADEFAKAFGEHEIGSRP